MKRVTQFYFILSQYLGVIDSGFRQRVERGAAAQAVYNNNRAPFKYYRQTSCVITAINANLFSQFFSGWAGGTWFVMQAEWESFRCYFTAPDNGRVTFLLPGKQNNDLWNGWCGSFSVFCSSLMTTMAPFFYPGGHAPSFRLNHCLFTFFRTSLARTHFRLPPSSHIRTLHMWCTHTHTTSA